MVIEEITLELRNMGFIVNHKKVLRLNEKTRCIIIRKIY